MEVCQGAVMPLYEYECDSCGRRFERIQKFSDPLIAECPTCGGPVRKLLSSPAIQFKGSGFYITDYPKSGAGKDAAGSKGASDKSSKSETAGQSEKSEKSDKADASSSSTSGSGSDSSSSSAKAGESTKSDSASPATKKSDS
jgi:putative FmdB family regulatory protein